MKEYTTGDWYLIAGRGDVAAVRSDYDEAPSVGSAVKIDGHVYCVVGVEIMGFYKPGSIIGILVHGDRIKSVEYFSNYPSSRVVTSTESN